MSPEEDQPGNRVPLSALNHYAYCPRRCYLIHAEGEFVENAHTLRGRAEHERVDLPRHEARAGVRVETGLPVWSEALGLSGRCDAVEFHPDGSVYPVEYKHGPRKRWLNDDLQLAAQAMCLEQMLGQAVDRGAVYHLSSRRRREVVIDDGLRAEVAAVAAAIHALLTAGRLPPPTDQTRRCKECSLHPVCAPEMAFAADRIDALAANLFKLPDDELP